MPEPAPAAVELAAQITVLPPVDASFAALETEGTYMSPITPALPADLPLPTRGGFVGSPAEARLAACGRLWNGIHPVDALRKQFGMRPDERFEPDDTPPMPQMWHDGLDPIRIRQWWIRAAKASRP